MSEPERGVAYYLKGSGHAVQLLVSLTSLRRYWAGPVAILTDDPPGSAPYRIAAAFGATVHALPLCQLRRNSCLVTKTWLYRYTPFACTLFLDADTYVKGHALDVWPSRAEQCTWTEFSDWRSFGSPYQGRIERAGTVDAEAQQLADSTLARNPAAVNTGVMCFWRDAEVLPLIHELAKRIHRIFIPDEIATQLLYWRHPHRLVDDRFNSSPRHGRHVAREEIVHCHGGKVLSARVKREWLALFAEVYRSNRADVLGWPEPEAVAEVTRYHTASTLEGIL